MFDRIFRLRENGTTVRTELLAGLTTFLTMAYIIFVQPAVLTGDITNMPTGMDFGAVLTATCLAAALATLIMGLYARYPIAQAPGMGENFFFALTLFAAAKTMIGQQVASGQIAAGSTEPWKIGLGVVFLSGVLFFILSMLGVREKLMEAISPSMRHGIAGGTGLFIAFIGLQLSSLVQIVKEPVATLAMNPRFASPDLIVFFFGLLVMSVLQARRVRGAILWGILAGGLLAVALKLGLPLFGDGVMKSKCVAESMLVNKFQFAEGFVSLPPSLAPTFLEMDLRGALRPPMIPFIFIFLFMVLFDTLGTLIGVAERAGFIKDDKLPRAHRALMSDAVGTVAGAALGTSTVVSFIESASGVEQGGRTGLTAVTVAVLFLLSLFFSPIIQMIGSYPPITTPALVVVGAMMIGNVRHIEWDNFAESIPAFLILIGIPMAYSIADGLALGFIAYPVVKLLSGQGRDVKWMMYVMALILVAYFLLVLMPMG
ncbi:MAG: NCS2 family permease [Pirellulales bacterium]|nr:NCS2 family permease [Pirellulales bacterium]